ncbi:MAG: hypothetical protein KA116_11775 [Proteobacteria bacterium]|nr:hypothetical protein [Pseudomonadota bacterium]
MKRVFVLFLILIFNVHGAYAVRPASSKKTVSKDKVDSKAPSQSSQNSGVVFSEKSKLWLGLGAGLFLGFGSGQAVQGRWKEMGCYFTAADSVGLLMLLSGLGDSRDGRSGTMETVVVSGGILYVTSRILQLVELGIYGVQNGLFDNAQANKHAAYFESDKYNFIYKRPSPEFLMSQQILAF